MMAYNPRARGYLLAGCLLLLATAGLFVAGRSRLPYGHHAWPVAMGILALSLLVGSFWAKESRLRDLLSASGRWDLPVLELPAAPEATFLGRGFAWTPGHVSRLAAASGIEVGDERGATSGPGKKTLIHGVGADACRDLFIPNAILSQHLLALGAPGSGKTRFLEVLIEQAVRRGDAVVVIDPKGDERLLDRTYDAAVSAGRGADFRFFALPYPYQSCRYNPLAHYVRANEITDRIALILPRGGGDAEAFRNFAWDFVNTVTTALDLLKERISIATLQNYCLHNTWLLVRKLMRFYYPGVDTTDELKSMLDQYHQFEARQGKGIVELDQLIQMASMDRKYFDKVSSALKPVFSKLMSRTVGYLLSPGDVFLAPSATEAGPAPELSWKTVDRDRQVVYFFLGSMLGVETASGVARVTLADLQSYLGKKYAYEPVADYGRITVVVDEMGDVLAPETVHLLNKARGAELSMCLAGQSLADLEVALRSPADSRRALANVAALVAFRTQNPEDARYFSEKCGRRPMPVVTESESYEPALFSSGNHAIEDFAFRSSRTVALREQDLVPAHLLGQLPGFHFFAHHSGAVWKGVVPLLDAPARQYSARLKGSFA
jgi:conjugal transfer pilus assembly protein TraD